MTAPPTATARSGPASASTLSGPAGAGALPAPVAPVPSVVPVAPVALTASSASVRAELLPWLHRVPVGGWAALAWAAGLAYTIALQFPLPGESHLDFHPGLDLPFSNGVTLVLAAAISLSGSALLRRRPLSGTTLLLVGAMVTAMVRNSLQIEMQNFLGCTVALWFVAANGGRRQVRYVVAATVLLLVGYPVVRLASGWTIGTSATLVVPLAAAVAVLLGRSERQARERQGELSAHAAEQAVAGERLRIARELHDMVAHTLGIVALQSGAARRVIATQPDRARDAIGAVETASRETLAGLRRMLVVLRAAEPGGQPGGEGVGVAPLHPVPGLADLDALVAATTAAGVRVELERGDLGGLSALSAEAQLAAYRIVQEALTNVVRHSGAGSCQVGVGVGVGVGGEGGSADGEALTVQVTDPGPRRTRRSGERGPDRSPGFGLLGMRERVDLLGGTFTAGPHHTGFRVQARIPLAEAEQ